jgi:hypothetical protein
MRFKPAVALSIVALVANPAVSIHCGGGKPKPPKAPTPPDLPPPRDPTGGGAPPPAGGGLSDAGQSLETRASQDDVAKRIICDAIGTGGDIAEVRAGTISFDEFAGKQVQRLGALYAQNRIIDAAGTVFDLLQATEEGDEQELQTTIVCAG